MGTIIKTLRDLNVGGDDFVYLNYEDRTSVWHVSDDYVETALAETETAGMLAGLLATRGVTVYSRYEEDILDNMRTEGLLEDYEREGWFEEYLTETIQTEGYQYDLLTVATERHDHKRGTCEVSANVKVKACELFALEGTADTFVAGFEVAVHTPAGTLTLNS